MLTFEHADASGMSYRSTRANGVVNDFEGTEMSPVELDPKGSNVGTTTPYIEEPLINEPPPEITNNFPLFDQSPTDRTGQTVGCVVEGFRQTGFGLCQQAMESARLGGIFGLVERAARMSALPPVKIGEWWRRFDTTYADKGEVIRVGIDDRYKLSDVYADNNWSAMSSIFSWEVRAEQPSQPADKGGMNKCEKKLATTFTDEPNAQFEDVGDGDDYDGAGQINRPIGIDGTNTHHHLYPDVPTGNIQKRINVYAPAGGVIVDSGKDSAKQNYITVFYKKLGTQTNVGLQILHVENYKKGGTPQKDGSILLGQTGENGSYSYYVGSKRELRNGFHIHINAFKWWGVRNKPVLARDNKGKPIKFPQGDRTNQILKLSDLFCNNLQ